ncbi:MULTISPECIES: hypothetical protein [Mycolicibacter]|uniref:Uncharacterized protein n=2 Tax=Mycolicibacter TaxID=1073531 RepID=A0ABU5XL79_9MYCO|nr:MULTISPECIES: hypothetical protein [unclassified Mycolicibacter]MEB3023017.1 hypothetical protein [Mycolicibacter sp. MYC098]MEB3033527.1 hypothetical protein [Mycolicibacter sp. MYC340]
MNDPAEQSDGHGQMSDKASEHDQRRERDLEAVAANIIHQMGDLLYEALPPDVAHKHFVGARQATNDRGIDFAKTLISDYAANTAGDMPSADAVLTVPSAGPEPQEMAHRLVATALMMKREYQSVGLGIAREFCTEYGIDVNELERTLRQAGVPFGRIDPNNPRMGQIDATQNGEAWFWRHRRHR